jgi:phage-related protein
MKNVTHFGRSTVLIEASLPMPQVSEALNPVGEAYVDLFEIHLRPSGVVYFKNSDPVVWQGNTYEGTAARLTGVETSAEK